MTVTALYSNCKEPVPQRKKEEFLMNYTNDAKAIVQAVGGKSNINSVAHCATRLRFVLQDESKVDEKALDAMDIVKGTFSTNGQYQIIIGAGTVNQVCDEVNNVLGNSGQEGPAKEEPKQSGHYVQRAVKLLSDIFVPIIPAIVAGGLLMGLYNVLSAPFFNGGETSLIQMYPQFSGLATMLNTFSNAPFTFLPVLIGFSATKKFGGNPFLGAAMGMIMVHPDLLNAYNLGKPEFTAPVWDLFGLSIPAIGYQGTVLPVLLVSWILATIEKKLHKITPSWLDNLTTPLLAIIITGFLTFLFVGPAMRSLGDGISAGITWVYNTLGFVGGAIFGGFYAPIVITGMHHSFIAIETQLIADAATTGGSFIFVTASMSNVAQGAAVLAVLLITKNEKIKSLCSASGISALLGITEPAMFGVNLKLRYPFIAACIGSACGSAWIAFTKTLAIALGAAGIPGFISVHPSHWLDFAIGLIISMVIAFVLTLVLGKRDAAKQAAIAGTNEQISLPEEETKEEIKEVSMENVSVALPLDGDVKPVSESSDPVFAQKTMGDGIVVTPKDGKVYAPEDCKVEFVFPTKHAIGITTTSGVSLLIHCGIDTVQLDGKHFTTYVEQGSEITKGTLMLSFDIEAVKNEGFSVETPVVVTNLSEGQHIEINAKGNVEHGEEAFRIVK